MHIDQRKYKLNVERFGREWRNGGVAEQRSSGSVGSEWELGRNVQHLVYVLPERAILLHSRNRFC